MSSNKQGIPREEANKVLQLIKFLERKPESAEFKKPVDYVGLGLTDYTTIIKKPMDLSTVKKKVRVSAYQNIAEAIDDLTLIWENCKTYNPEEHYIYCLLYTSPSPRDS